MAKLRLKLMPAKVALVLVSALALLAPSAEAHRGGGGSRDGRSDRSNNSGHGKSNYPQSTTKSYNMPGNDNGDSYYSDAYKTRLKEYYDSLKDKDSGAALGSGSTGDSNERDTHAYGSSDEAQSEYFSNVAKYYRSASSQTLAVGVVATAEGLAKMSNRGVKFGESSEGDTLIATGLKSLEAGQEMKKQEQETLDKIQQAAAPAEADSELMADPIAEEVIADLSEKTGFSPSEIVEKILGSKGSLDALADEFEGAAKRKEKIELAKEVSAEELEATLVDSKTGSLRKKINFASLREALATSATLARNAPERKITANALVEPGSAPAGPAEPMPKAKPEMTARAPASGTELMNLGENLPSFELEQNQSEEAEEASLFEKVHRKYAEIAPSMWRSR